MLKYVQKIHYKTYFNGIDAKFFLQLCTLLHNRCGEFQNRILVVPGVSPTSFVNFSLVQHLLSIDVNQMIGELSVFWGRSSFCIANGFICSTCFQKKNKQLNFSQGSPFCIRLVSRGSLGTELPCECVSL